MTETPHFLKLLGVEPNPKAGPEELARIIDIVLPEDFEQRLGQLSSTDLKSILGSHAAVLAFLKPKKNMPAGICHVNIRSDRAELASATPSRHSSRYDLSSILTNYDIGSGSLEQWLLEN